ncbi:MAG: DUF3134 domain-containing protein [Pseudanabaenaceae cyanobacterium]
MHNPALREEPRYQPAPVVGNSRQASMLSWLESTGRLVAKDVAVPDYADDVEDLSDLMAGDEDYIDLEDEEEELIGDEEDEDLL